MSALFYLDEDSRSGFSAWVWWANPSNLPQPERLEISSIAHFTENGLLYSEVGYCPLGRYPLTNHVGADRTPLFSRNLFFGEGGGSMSHNVAGQLLVVQGLNGWLAGRIRKD